MGKDIDDMKGKAHKAKPANGAVSDDGRAE
jgi:hypothetical protein